MSVHELFFSPTNFEALAGVISTKYTQMMGGLALPGSYRSLILRLMKQTVTSAPIYRPSIQDPTDYVKMLNRGVLELFLKSLSSDLRGQGGAAQMMQRQQTIPPRKIADVWLEEEKPSQFSRSRKAETTDLLEKRLEDTIRRRGGPAAASAPSSAASVPELQAQRVPAEDVHEMMRRLEEETLRRKPEAVAAVLEADHELSQLAETIHENDHESWEDAFEAIRRDEEVQTKARVQRDAEADSRAFRDAANEMKKSAQILQDCMQEWRGFQATEISAPAATVPAEPMKTSPRATHVIDSSHRNPNESPVLWNMALDFPASWAGGKARWIRGWLPRTSFFQQTPLLRLWIGGSSVVCEVDASTSNPSYVTVKPLQEPPLLDTVVDQPRLRVTTIEGDELPAYPDVYEIDAWSRNIGETADMWILRTKTMIPNEVTHGQLGNVRIWGTQAEPPLPLQGNIKVMKVQPPYDIEVRINTPGDKVYEVRRPGMLVLGMRPALWLFEKIEGSE